jgi:hypothetical protein
MYDDVERAQPILGLLEEGLDVRFARDVRLDGELRPPAPLISLTTPSALPELPAYFTTTAKPSRANRCATARPIPPEAPVTIALRPMTALRGLGRKVAPRRVLRGAFDETRAALMRES